MLLVTAGTLQDMATIVCVLCLEFSLSLLLDGILRVAESARFRFGHCQQRVDELPQAVGKATLEGFQDRSAQPGISPADGNAEEVEDVDRVINITCNQDSQLKGNVEENILP